MHAFDALARAEVVGNWFYPFESATLMEQEARLRRSTNETDHLEPSRLAVLDLCQTVAAVDNTDLKSADAHICLGTPPVAHMCCLLHHRGQHGRPLWRANRPIGPELLPT